MLHHNQGPICIRKSRPQFERQYGRMGVIFLFNMTVENSESHILWVCKYMVTQKEYGILS